MLINLSTCLGVNGQSIGTSSQDTVIHQSSSNSDAYEETDDFSPGLLFFALIGLSLVLACIGAGIAVTVIAMLIVFGLIAFGVLSTSVAIGLYKRSFANGFKTFVVLSSSIGGMVICAVGLGVMNAVWLWWTLQTAIMAGAVIGAMSGVGFGYLAFYMLRYLGTLFMNKLGLNDTNKINIGNMTQV